MCSVPLYCKPCHAPSTKHILSTNTVLVCLYVLYSARNVFKSIIGYDCYPLLVLRLPNDFLFHSEPKVARWDPLHQYRTTNSVLGVDVNMSEWGWVRCGMPMVQGVEVQCE